MIMWIAFGTFWIRFRVRDCEGSKERERIFAGTGGEGRGGGEGEKMEAGRLSGDERGD